MDSGSTLPPEGRLGVLDHVSFQFIFISIIIVNYNILLSQNIFLPSCASRPARLTICNLIQEQFDVFSRYGADVNSMSDTGSTPGIYFTFT